ncbi:unnamed protein product [Amoebophrya sp. A120]|nr:unnamed protein product [Amoebophrya sp. A120]|eukprot:GSA120T00015049001.1
MAAPPSKLAAQRQSCAPFLKQVEGVGLPHGSPNRQRWSRESAKVPSHTVYEILAKLWYADTGDWDFGLMTDVDDRYLQEFIEDLRRCLSELETKEVPEEQERAKQNAVALYKRDLLPIVEEALQRQRDNLSDSFSSDMDWLSALLVNRLRENPFVPTTVDEVLGSGSAKENDLGTTAKTVPPHHPLWKNKPVFVKNQSGKGSGLYFGRDEARNGSSSTSSSTGTRCSGKLTSDEDSYRGCGEKVIQPGELIFKDSSLITRIEKKENFAADNVNKNCSARSASSVEGQRPEDDRAKKRRRALCRYQLRTLFPDFENLVAFLSLSNCLLPDVVRTSTTTAADDTADARGGGGSGGVEHHNRAAPSEVVQQNQEHPLERSCFEMSMAEHIEGIYVTNAITVADLDNPFELCGTALFPLVARMQHSDTPNCDVQVRRVPCPKGARKLRGANLQKALHERIDSKTLAARQRGEPTAGRCHQENTNKSDGRGSSLSCSLQTNKDDKRVKSTSTIAFHFTAETDAIQGFNTHHRYCLRQDHVACGDDYDGRSRSVAAGDEQREEQRDEHQAPLAHTWEAFVVALRPIPPGEELTIDYVGLHWFLDRRRTLLRDYRFCLPGLTMGPKKHISTTAPDGSVAFDDRTTCLIPATHRPGIAALERGLLEGKVRKRFRKVFWMEHDKGLVDNITPSLRLSWREDLCKPFSFAKRTYEAGRTEQTVAHCFDVETGEIKPVDSARARMADLRPGFQQNLVMCQTLEEFRERVSTHWAWIREQYLFERPRVVTTRLPPRHGQEQSMDVTLFPTRSVAAASISHHQLNAYAECEMEDYNEEDHPRDMLAHPGNTIFLLRQVQKKKDGITRDLTVASWSYTGGGLVASLNGRILFPNERDFVMATHGRGRVRDPGLDLDLWLSQSQHVAAPACPDRHNSSGDEDEQRAAVHAQLREDLLERRDFSLREYILDRSCDEDLGRGSSKTTYMWSFWRDAPLATQYLAYHCHDKATYDRIVYTREHHQWFVNHLQLDLDKLMEEFLRSLTHKNNGEDGPAPDGNESWRPWIALFARPSESRERLQARVATLLAKVQDFVRFESERGLLGDDFAHLSSTSTGTSSGQLNQQLFPSTAPPAPVTLHLEGTGAPEAGLGAGTSSQLPHRTDCTTSRGLNFSPGSCFAQGAQEISVEESSPAESLEETVASAGDASRDLPVDGTTSGEEQKGKKKDGKMISRRANPNGNNCAANSSASSVSSSTPSNVSPTWSSSSRRLFDEDMQKLLSETLRKSADALSLGDIVFLFHQGLHAAEFVMDATELTNPVLRARIAFWKWSLCGHRREDLEMTERFLKLHEQTGFVLNVPCKKNTAPAPAQDADLAHADQEQAKQDVAPQEDDPAMDIQDRTTASNLASRMGMTLHTAQLCPNWFPLTHSLGAAENTTDPTKIYLPPLGRRRGDRSMNDSTNKEQPREVGLVLAKGCETLLQIPLDARYDTESIKEGLKLDVHVRKNDGMETSDPEYFGVLLDQAEKEPLSEASSDENEEENEEEWSSYDTAGSD